MFLVGVLLEPKVRTQALSFLNVLVWIVGQNSYDPDSQCQPSQGLRLRSVCRCDSGSECCFSGGSVFVWEHRCGCPTPASGDDGTILSLLWLTDIYWPSRDALGTMEKNKGKFIWILMGRIKLHVSNENIFLIFWYIFSNTHKS